MKFEYPGYELKFIQKEPCTDLTAHRFTLIFKFFSPVTKLHYVLRADYHDCDIFVLKFYCKAHRKSDRKYNIIVNRGDLGNIFITCTKVIPLLLQTFPTASFGLAGARSIDSKGRVEDFKNNQRFRIYSQLISTKIGPVTFEHFEYPHVSSYLLLNKKYPDILKQERAIADILVQTYQDLIDIQ